MNGVATFCLNCRARTRPGAEWCGLCHSPLPGDGSSRAPEPTLAEPAADATDNLTSSPQMQPESSGTGIHSTRTSNKALVIVMLLVTALFKLTTIAGAANVTTGTIDPRGFKFQYVSEETGAPLRFNPCTPVHYAINPQNAPPGGIEDVHTAIRMTSEASGLRFIYDGTTDEVFVQTRESYQPDRYGKRWAPILISWLPGMPLRSNEAGKETLGLGGSSYATNANGDIVYVTGAATFASSADLRSGFGGRTWGQVILHELGHVLGLDHIEGGESVMHASLGLRSAAWSDGDRAGLWELGVGGTCIETPSLP